MQALVRTRHAHLLGQWLMMMLLTATLLFTTSAEARGSSRPRLDSKAKKEIKWIEKTLDYQAGCARFLQQAVTRTTDTEILALYAEVQTSLTVQQATLHGWLATWYSRTYTPRPRNLAGSGDDDEDDDDDDDSVWTAEMFDLNTLVNYQIHLRNQGKEAKKLKHVETRRFGAELSREAYYVITLGREWIRMLEEINGVNDDDDDDDDDDRD